MTGVTIATAQPLIDIATPASSFLDEVKSGLKSQPPQIPCKYLYDERGSHLFDRICEMEEYYPTRTEMQIMREHVGEMAEAIGPDALLVEYGSGSSMKTRILLDELEQLIGYVPIDISKEHLVEAADRIAEEYPDLWVQPICADYTQSVMLPDEAEGRRVVYFPGSTIGNFSPDEAVEMLKRFRQTAGENGSVLIGVDLKKDPAVLQEAYNDRLGVTAAFNKNVLHRMKRELGATVNPAAFAHHAPYDREAGFVEMRLVCRAPQTITVDDEQFGFEPGDYIRTERSHKFTIDEFAQLASRAGLCQQHVWTDDRNYFSVQYYDVVD